MTVRARNLEAKLARRHLITEAVAQQLRHRPCGSVTMSEIAAASGMAKGTLYLYFSSKEELLLAALDDEFVAWCDDVADKLAERERVAPSQFAAIVVHAMSQRQCFAELLAMMRTLLEENPRSETAAAFRSTMRQKLETLAPAIEAVLQLRPGTGAGALARMLALIIGMQSIPLPPAEFPSADAPSAGFDSGRDIELRDSIATLVRGASVSAGLAERHVPSSDSSPKHAEKVGA